VSASLAPDLYLLTYTLPQPTRVATVWRARPEGWQMADHQGTVVIPA
jgi:hypothetical protein